MAYAVSQWVAETRRYLNSGQNEERNILAAPYTAGGTTLSFLYDTRSIQPGVTISAGLNVFYILSVDATAKTATVLGGQNGAADVSLAVNVVVRIKPRFPDSDILQALNDDLLDLSNPGAGLYQMSSVNITYSQNFVGYDLVGVVPGSIIDIYEVRYDYSSSYKHQPRIPRDAYRLERINDLVKFPSGYRLELFHGGMSGYLVTVLYRTAFNPILTLADDVIPTTGLPPTARDLPPMGAALRLVVGREIARNFTDSQGDTRRATEVPPGAVGGSWRGLAQMRERRIQAEAVRLQSAYPIQY